MEEMVIVIVGFVCCLMIIITLILAVCWYGAENSRLYKENRRLRRVLEDYARLEQASLDAQAALSQETQRYMAGWPSR